MCVLDCEPVCVECEPVCFGPPALVICAVTCLKPLAVRHEEPALGGSALGGSALGGLLHAVVNTRQLATAASTFRLDRDQSSCERWQIAIRMCAAAAEANEL